jgi:LmbE family N-acetylglucosaminyl deacetylase
MKKYKQLIISPHIDDDVLGCGGVTEDDTYILYCGVDDFHVVSRNERLKEASEVSNFLGSKFELLHGHKVNEYETINFIDEFSTYINKIKPDKIYIPHPSYNQDHRAIYEAVMISLRPHDVNYFVKKVLVYEQPHNFFWDNNNNDFKPNYFVPIDIDRKINAYELMKSQVRSFRSIEHIRSLALLRGGQSNCEYAEAFQVLRWVD